MDEARIAIHRIQTKAPGDPKSEKYLRRPWEKAVEEKTSPPSEQVTPSGWPGA